MAPDVLQVENHFRPLGPVPDEGVLAQRLVFLPGLVQLLVTDSRGTLLDQDDDILLRVHHLAEQHFSLVFQGQSVDMGHQLHTLVQQEVLVLSLDVVEHVVHCHLGAGVFLQERLAEVPDSFQVLLHQVDVVGLHLIL